MAKKSVEKKTVDVELEVTETVEEVKKEIKKVVEEPLNDYDEIEVISLQPNVSYKDKHTNDIYEWYEVGHTEYMSFEVLKNMWRNHKDYFKSLYLKPNDDRVIKKFGLTRTFEDYEYLMEEDNYTKQNIKDICETIHQTPNKLKRSIFNKIKLLVAEGKVTDVYVIRELERRLGLSLIEFL